MLFFHENKLFDFLQAKKKFILKIMSSNSIVTNNILIFTILLVVKRNSCQTINRVLKQIVRKLFSFGLLVHTWTTETEVSK